MKMRWQSLSKKWKVAIIVIVILVAFRLALPFIVTRYVNNVLADLPGYRGQIDGVTISLIRGAYQIKELKLFQVTGHKEIPFIAVPLMDLSVEWNALFKGKIVGEILFDRPALNFIASKKETKKGGTPEQTGEDVDWTEPVKKLIPLQINRLIVRNGKITFFDFSTRPKVDLFFEQVQIDAQNLNNASKTADTLPSKIYMQARSIGNGMLSVTMRINVLKQIPDLDMDMKFENVNMKALNDFFEAYAKVDVEEGNFNLYSELAVLDGNITGYVKPLLNNLKVADFKSDKDKPLRLVWESIVGFLVEVFENQKKNQFATRVPLEGQLSKIESSFWPALWNIFRNAFIDAFENSTDNTITIAATKKEDDKKSKREERRAKRKRERKERDSNGS